MRMADRFVQAHVPSTDDPAMRSLSTAWAKQAAGINSAGQILGYSDTSTSGDRHAAIWKGTVATVLNQFVDPNIAGAGCILQRPTESMTAGGLSGRPTTA